MTITIILIYARCMKEKLIILFSIIFLTSFFFFFKQNSLAYTCSDGSGYRGDGQECNNRFLCISGLGCAGGCHRNPSACNGGCGNSDGTCFKAPANAPWPKSNSNTCSDAGGYRNPLEECSGKGICYDGSCNAGCGRNPDACPGGFKNCVNGACTLPPGPSHPLNTTPTGTPSSGSTTASIAVYLEGIDANNNNNPAHPTGRQLTLYFYKNNNYGSDPTGNAANFKSTGILNFQTNADANSNQYYWALSNFPLGNITTGNYYVLAKSPEGSLRTLISSTPITITASKANTIIDPTVQGVVIPVLKMGDINGDNSVNILDYNVIRDCYGLNSTGFIPSTCSTQEQAYKDATKGYFADLNDDGMIDGIDYNMVLRNLGTNGF